MKIATTQQQLKHELEALRQQRIGFVPTMGALHAGHLSLIETAKQHADVVVASIFVNPTQFAPDEDFDHYPRSQAEDIAKLKAAGVDVVYLPEVEEIYENSVILSEGRQPTAEASQKREQDPSTPLRFAQDDKNTLSSQLEGEHRPHFFSGVKQVVGILFDQVQPDMAVFGEKDYQQLAVIRQMVKEQGRAIEMIGAPTLREADGLAMSSRNRYLNAEEREVAPLLYQVIGEVKSRVAEGKSIETSKAWAFETLMHGGFNDVDYIAVRDAATFQPVTSGENPFRVLAAAWLGKTRLIDNV